LMMNLQKRSKREENKNREVNLYNKLG